MENRLILHCIDGDSRTRAEMARAAFSLGHHAEVYGSIEELIDHQPCEGILFVRDDAHQGELAQKMERITNAGIWLPVVAMAADPGTSQIVAAIKSGALDYLRLPVDLQQFATMLRKINDEAMRQADERRRMVEARGRIASLSGREREVLEWLAEGSSNKAIARELAISPRTVEIHRANMMTKLGAKHAAEAVRLRIEAQMDPPSAG